MASIVFKVKYEETLRRFNVAVKEDSRLDLNIKEDTRLDINIEGLRLKIRSLFNFPPDSDFSLTYKDEDNELVVLGDDDDLLDVMRQDLDPVRITVQLRPDQNSQSFSTPSRNAAPSTPSPQNVQPNVAEVVKSLHEALGHVLLNLNSTAPNSQQNRNLDVATILNSVKEPLAQAMSKLSLDVSSKAVSTSPILADLFDGLSKIGQSCVNAALSNSGATGLSSDNKVGSGSKPISLSESIKSATGVSSHNKVGSVSKPICLSEGIKNALSNSGATGVSSHNKVGSGSKPISLSEGIKNADIDTAYMPLPVPKITLATAVPSGTSLSCDKGKKTSCVSSSNKKFSSSGMKKGKDTSVSKRGAGVSTGFVRAMSVNASEESYINRMHSGGLPFPGIPLEHDQNFKPMHPSAGSLGMDTIFHKGVRCDGCGVLPITGPRFKSKVKYDYDLCSICFSQIGNDVEYTRFNLPLANVHPWSFKVPDSSFRHGMMRPHASQHLLSKLDSRFIMDVNVMDGAIMAPLTPFTKIWRMRNSGMLSWNHGFQLICIGGDRFSRSNSVEIKVPSTGLNVGHELDIAVDFIAPESPGRYISYWRMADSSSQMFGQRVWVQIQVDLSMDLTRESSPMLNLNLPPNSNETTFAELVDVKTEPDFNVEVGDSSAPSIPEDNRNVDMVSLNFPTNSDFLATSSSSVPPPAACTNETVPLWRPSSDSLTNSGTYFYPSKATPIFLPRPSSISNFVGGTQSYPFQEASAPFLPYPTISTLGESSIDASNVQADNSDCNVEKAPENVSSSVSASAASVKIVNMPSRSMREIFPTRLPVASAPLSPYPITPTLGEPLTRASNVNASSEGASSISPPVVSANMPVTSAQPSSVSYPEVETYPPVRANHRELLPNTSSLQNGNGNQELASEQPSSVSYPEVETYPPIRANHRELLPDTSSLQNGNGNQEQASEQAKFEDKLLKELALMGFNDLNFNLEVLRMNEYDMGRAVEDLCDVSEWDPMLKELNEMGFNDKVTNRRLLEKNNGSITRVVMDLIAEETP